MLASTRALLAGIIDYAGTFPPAGLSLAEVVQLYAQVKGGPNGWLVGRLILPAAGLREFEQMATSCHGAHLSVVLGPRPETGLAGALAFDARRVTGYRVASVEFPPLNPSDIGALRRAVPDGVEAFFEVPIDADLERRIGAVAASGAMAKVRTGGATAGVFPNPADLARFLEACADAGVAFKASAGLHHCLRGCYALNYEPGSQADTMHGFLNLSIAAAVVHGGGTPAEAVDVLAESSAEMFEFRAEGIVWRRRTIATPDLAAMRRLFFRSFGSCSVREPIDELTTLGLL